MQDFSRWKAYVKVHHDATATWFKPIDADVVHTHGHTFCVCLQASLLWIRHTGRVLLLLAPVPLTRATFWAASFGEHPWFS